MRYITEHYESGDTQGTYKDENFKIIRRITHKSHRETGKPCDSWDVSFWWMQGYD
jgi:hypothetical protein